ncbi:MAG: hypothetical protein ACYCZN_01410 [Candidatus Dormibacteria bacterium]
MSEWDRAPAAPAVRFNVDALARLRPELAAELRVWAALYRPPAQRPPSRDAIRA